MPAVRYYSPLDISEQKLQIEMRLGCAKAHKYFSLLSRYLSLKISKCEFDRICIATIGRDNIQLHNHLLKSILKKVSTSKTALPRKSTVDSSVNVIMPNGCDILQTLSKDFPQTARKGRTPNLRERRFKDRPSPLGPHGMNNGNASEDPVPKTHEQQSNIKPHALGCRSPLSVEDSEEVNQEDSESLTISRRSPIRAPLGIPTYNRRARRILYKGLASDTAAGTCGSFGQLPDTCSLTKLLEPELETEGLKIAADAVELLNGALDVYLKRLIKPCLELAASKSVYKYSGRIPKQPSLNGLQVCHVPKSIGHASASISDFRTAMKFNPVLLGENWPLLLEKVCFRESEE